MKKTILLALIACITTINSITTLAGSKVFDVAPLFDSLKKGEKGAILMVHFGTTHDDTRQATIDMINNKAKNQFVGIEVREAWTSRIIMKRLKERGVTKQNPKETLTQLFKDGYTHVLIQPTFIIDGVEMESLRADVAHFTPKFKEIRVGTPLLFFDTDYEAVIDALTAFPKHQEATLWVGHGTYDVSTAQYAMLDYMLKEKGHTNHFVGCIEGYPYFEQALKQIKNSGLKKVRLIPFMFVAGEHAKNDIAEDWKQLLEDEGFEIEVDLRGLGELNQIQNRFIELLRFYSQNRRIGIMEKKNQYQNTGEKMTEE